MPDLYLKWTSHLELLASLEQLLQDKSFVDVTIAVEGQLLQAHKVILSASSPYFNSFLCSNPTQHPVIFMRDVKFLEMKAILDFIYRGEVSINEEHLNGMLKTAKALRITGLCNISWTESVSAVQSSDSPDVERDDVHIHVINPLNDGQSSFNIDTTGPPLKKECTHLIQLHETNPADDSTSSGNVAENKDKMPLTVTQQDMAELIQQDYGEVSGLVSDDDSTVIILETPPEVSITSVPTASGLERLPGRQYTKEHLQQALDMVRKGQMGIKPAARAYNIPVATLHHAARRNKIASPLQQGGNHMFYRAWKSSKESTGNATIVSSDWAYMGK